MPAVKFQGGYGDQDLEIVDVDGLEFSSFCPLLFKKKHLIVIKLKNTYKFLSFQKICLPKSTLQNILHQALLIKMFLSRIRNHFTNSFPKIISIVESFSSWTHFTKSQIYFPLNFSKRIWFCF